MKIKVAIILVITIFSCRAQKVNEVFYSESVSLMQYIFSDFEKNSKKLERKISHVILNKPSVAEYRNFKDLISNVKNHIPLALNYSIIESKTRIDYSKIFTQDEIKHMVKQINNKELKTWKNYLKIKPKSRYIPEEKNEYVKKIKASSNIYFYSIPVFIEDFSHGLIYRENGFGGELIIYQKVNNKWRAVASATVWIS